MKSTYETSSHNQNEQVQYVYHCCLCLMFDHRAFSHDFTAAMLVFQNKEMAAMMVYQTNHPGIDLYFYAKYFPLFQ